MPRDRAETKKLMIAAYEKKLGKELPVLLSTKEVEILGIRTKASLDNDAVEGIGLLPIRDGGHGHPRRYFIDDVFDFLLGEGG